ncbi:MAG: hypothetical protein PHE83_18015 [Opitutaceae bacterium]|nr:hypothetical protein [Opitutaceae bacterium]
MSEPTELEARTGNAADWQKLADIFSRLCGVDLTTTYAPPDDAPWLYVEPDEENERHAIEIRIPARGIEVRIEPQLSVTRYGVKPVLRVWALVEGEDA